MPTIKLVVIGASGVGKTSLRGQYISGRFSNGYRATIGADFITKTLPHPSNPADSVTLQIWDTAGQERFSSLSTAFFRGADAALLMFDVNTPATMTALTKWWAEFRERAPLADEDMEDYCCVVVGNKLDLTGSGGKNGETPVTEAEALRFLNGLVPPTSRSPSPVYDFPLLDEPASEEAADDDELLAASQITIRPASPRDSPPLPPPPSSPPTRSDSIAIAPNNHSSHHRPPPTLSHSYSPKHRLSKSRSRSASHFYGGTMTTTHTTLTIYHTPSSSLFDVYQSARSSPEPWSHSADTSSSSSSSPSSPSTTTSTSAYPSLRARRRLTTLSTGSASSSSGATITPSLFARESQTPSALTSSTSPISASASTPDHENGDADVTGQHHYSFSTPLPPPPARGPKLFFTSAKTGQGVSEVFEYVARRVVRRWEYEERVEARRMHVREASAGETIRLGLGMGTGRKSGVGGGVRVFGCCT